MSNRGGKAIGGDQPPRSHSAALTASPDLIAARQDF